MITLGQELWFVRSDHQRTAHKLTVTAVGRKWATMSDRSRLDMATMRMEDPRHGCVYLCEGDYLRERENKDAWNRLLTVFRCTYAPQPGVEARHIAEARKLLGFPP